MNPRVGANVSINYASTCTYSPSLSRTYTWVGTLLQSIILNTERNYTMKHLKFILAVILIMAVLSSSFSAYALDDSESEYDVDSEIEVHTGYSFIYGQSSATSFESFDDYVKYSGEASKNIGLGDIYPMNYYFENYDYIYVPAFLKDKTDDILCIFISPRFCRVTYQVGDKTLDTYHYFKSDNSKSCEDCQEAFDNNDKTAVGNIAYYKNKGFGNKSETYIDGISYSCHFDKSFFEFSADFGLENMGDTPFVKVYVNEHMQEKDGKLYYMNDNNKPQSGWKTINGHKYYFRSSDKTAVCGKKAKIGGIVYSFNANGICKGKFTGYLMQNGSKVYYKNGKVQN